MEKRIDANFVNVCTVDCRLQTSNVQGRRNFKNLGGTSLSGGHNLPP